MGRDLLGHILLQLPDAIFLSEIFIQNPAFREDADIKPHHGEEEIRVVFRIHWHEGILPFNGRQASGQSIFDFPEDRSAEIDVMLHKTHAAIFGPALLVIVPDNILVIGIWVFSQISLDEIFGFIGVEFEDQVHLIDITAEQSDRVSLFNLGILEAHEIVGLLGLACQIAGSWETQRQQIQD